VRAVLEAPAEAVAGEVFNVGDSGENYRKLDLVELIGRETDRGEVVFVQRIEDPRDYKVAFGKIAERLGYRVTRTVPDGIREIIAALEEERFEDAFDGRYRNIA
jgi:nucleoside-diphosphate-sugar epimerase